MKFTDKTILTLMLSVLMLPIFTQESEDDEEGIETVITTASKVESDILNTSQAATVLSGDEVVRMGLTNIRDLSNMVPGLYCTRCCRTSW